MQGVGFRPFVYRHAVALGLAGFVRNDSMGVLIDVEGEPADIAELTRLLVDDPPPLARVAAVVTEAVETAATTGGGVGLPRSSRATTPARARGAGQRRHGDVRRLPGRGGRSG